MCRIADVRARVVLPLPTDFENCSVLKPVAHHEDAVATMLDQVIACGSSA